jgi:hypothetical protein
LCASDYFLRTNAHLLDPILLENSSEFDVAKELFG